MKIIFLSLLVVFCIPLCCFSEECFFSNLTLNQAENLALENNQDIQTLKQLLDKARAGHLEAISKWFPKLELMSVGYKTERRDAFTGTHSAFLSQFSFTQAILSTELYYNLRISKLIVRELELLLESMIIDVLYELRVTYYQLVLDCQNIATAEKNIELFTELAEKQRRNFEIGTNILLNVNQSMVAVANATSFYYEAIRKLRVHLDRFNVVLGYNPGSVEVKLAVNQIPIYRIPEIAEKVEKVQTVFTENESDGLIFKEGYPYTEKVIMAGLFTPWEVGCWESLALMYQPLLRVKENSVRIASQFVGAAKGEYLPEVVLHANYGGQPYGMIDYPSSNFINQVFDWGVGYQVNWLLFDSFGRDYRIKEALHERAAKKSEYIRGIQNAYEDVRRQIFLMEESVANYVTAESNVKLAEQTLELAKNQLEIGYITIFDYEIVVDGLIRAIYTRDLARFELMKGYYGLRHASGLDLVTNENE